jgi:hypothetical protein
MDTQAIRAQMPTLVVGHVPSNVRSFKFNIFDGQPKVSTLGFHIDPKPFEGKVIATTDEAIVVKTGRAEFAVLDRTLVTEVPDEGAKVQVEPYVRRRFDGQRADTPEEQTEFTADGQPYTVKRLCSGPHRRSCRFPSPAAPSCKNWSTNWSSCPLPTVSGASPTCWWMPARGTSPGSIRCPPTSSARHRPSASPSPR